MDILIVILAWVSLVFYGIGIVGTPFLIGRETTIHYTPGYYILKYIIFGSLGALLPLRVLGFI